MVTGLQDAEARVTRLFTEKLNVQVPQVDTDLIQSGILDSLTFVGLLHELELEFHVRFSLDDLELERFQSIRQIAQTMLQYGQR